MDVSYQLRPDGVAVICMNNPPLNPLSHGVRAGLLSHITEAGADPQVSAVILTGSGGNFSAGADIKEMAGTDGGVSRPPLLTEVVEAIEACPKPVVAAVDGVALGGGCEVALAAHYRVVTARARMGLPEVLIGLIPGAGGTQRLPRLVEAPVALGMITTGRMLKAKEALAVGLADHLVVGPSTGKKGEVSTAQLVEGAVGFVVSATKGRSRGVGGAAHHQPSWLDNRRCSKLPLRSDAREVEACITAALSKATKRGGGAAAEQPVRGNEPVWAAMQALRAAADASNSFEDGMRAEASLFATLIQSQQSRAKRHLFISERGGGGGKDKRNNKKGGASGAKAKAVRRVGVIGAGTMGAGIAIAHLMAGLEVTLVDVKQEALQRGLDYITRAVESFVRRKKMTPAMAKELPKRLKGATSLKEVADCDVVVEAVFENLNLKKKIFTELDQVCPPSTILVTNTSTLDIDAIASATRGGRPERVMGMHFFSPAHMMPLVECVRGQKTTPATIAAVVGLAKKLPGKVVVVVGNCDGFVGNRMLKSYTAEMVFMLEEGATPRQIDNAVKAFGMAIGPFEMSDLAGNDIGYLIRKERGLLDPNNRPKDERYSTLGDKLVEMGRTGQKAGKGWYRYEGSDRRALDDEEVDRLISEHRKETGMKPRNISDEEIVARCFYPLINEGFQILEEGIADRPSDIDLVWVYGYSWPRWRGGPMFWADEMGLSTLLSELERLGKALPQVSHWKPSALLKRLVDTGESLGGFYRRKAAMRSRL